MLNLSHSNLRPGIFDRREVLRLGGLRMLSLSLHALLNATAARLSRLSFRPQAVFG